MKVAGPEEIDVLRANSVDQRDSVLFLFSSPEARCLGLAQKLTQYEVDRICIISIVDEPNEDREKNRAKLRRLCRPIAPVDECEFKHSDSVYGLGELARIASRAARDGSVVAVDISTFPRNALLLTLGVLERLPFSVFPRILYTEPRDYCRELNEPISYGLSRLAVVPSFVAPLMPSQELVLIIFLGFERDRALGVWQNIEPHKTIAVVGRPAYHPEWEGVSEELNAALLSGLDDENVKYVDPRNPIAAHAFLREQLVDRPWPDGTNFYIAPMGTKPQVVGVYSFLREFPRAATVIYGSPVASNHPYISRGIGRVWELPSPGWI